MPVTLNKPALREFYTRITQDPAAKVDDAELNKLVAIVGDKNGFGGFFGISSDQLARRLANNPHFTREEKFELAKAGLDSTEKSDLMALIRDPAFAQKLDASVMNFIGALVGLEALKAADTAILVDRSRPEVQAAEKLRELVKTGKLTAYYDVMIGAKEDAALKAEAEKLFAALPVVKPGMGAADFVRAGLWTRAPEGVELMQKSARYLPGRQVQVETNVFAKLPAGWKPPKWSNDPFEAINRKIGTYDPTGPVAVTHRATLIGEDPANKNNFLVQVDGGDRPVSVTKASIYKHNHPHEVSPSYINSDTKRGIPWGGTWEIDYASPLAKAKLCEIALRMDDAVGQIDFRKAMAEATDGTAVSLGRGAAMKKLVELQKSCVETVFHAIDMEYPRSDGKPFNHPGRAPQGTRDVARQAIRGTGMCVQQSCVFGAMLTPFMDVLGVDGQYRSGNCFRNIKTAVDNVFAPDWETGHGWWQITFRPTMEMTVTDRTWNQWNLSMDRAYGFPGGDRNARSDIGGYVAKKLQPTDVDMSGNVVVQTKEREFARQGDGRENHISNRHDP